MGHGNNLMTSLMRPSAVMLLACVGPNRRRQFVRSRRRRRRPAGGQRKLDPRVLDLLSARVFRLLAGLDRHR
jgi:hypothetical protein